MKKYNKTLFFIGLSIVLCGPAFAQKWVKVSAGGRFSLALKSDGTIWSTGRNNLGQLGQGTIDTTPSNVFIQTGTDTDWVNVEAGEAHCLALKRDGTLWSWGNNGNGQLGVGDSIHRSSPQQIGSDNDWVFISPSGYSSYAIKKDGSIWGWGENFYGNIDSTRADKADPVKIDGKSKWRKICGGNAFRMSLRADGTLWACGWNTYGYLGNGNNINSYKPVQVNNDTDWVDISSGYQFSLALKRNGSIWAWGRNINGQLGQGNVTNLNVPTKIRTDLDWQKITTGPDFCFAIKKNGTLWGWGWNGFGGLGTGNTNQENIPIQIGKFNDWKMVSGGKAYVLNNYLFALHSLGLRGDGNEMCVTGQNDYGQLGLGNTDPINTFDCSIKAGINNQGVDELAKLQVYPSPTSDFVYIKFLSGEPFSKKILVFDASGKEVNCETIVYLNNSLQLQISTLPRGIYTIQIVSESKVFKEKFVKY